MSFNDSYTCPCCHQNRVLHSPAQAKQCSAWNKANLAPARDPKIRNKKKPQKSAADNFARWIHKREAEDRYEN